MAADLNIKLTGLDEFLKNLHRIPVELSQSIIKPALVKGAVVIEKSMMSKIKSFKIKKKGGIYTDADLRGTIGRIYRKGSTDVGYMAVGSRFPSMAYWLEYGTLAYRTEPLKRPRKPGAVAAAAKGLGLKKAPFARPGYEASKDRAMDMIRMEIEKGIAKIGK